jgi:nifR3 family TIM-barrel protein
MTSAPALSPSDELAGRLNRPLNLGPRTLDKRLVLAPMTQVGNVAFRELLAEFGGYGLLFSEMCSAGALPIENRRVSPCFRWLDEERDRLSFQITGAEPSVMAKAARRIAGEGLFGVDINFGCSVSALTCRRLGAALLKEPDRAAAIVEAVRKAVEVPVTVKFRTGWEDDPAPAVAMARRFEEAGADALTFHPRVAPDRRSRPPRWAYIGRVVEAVSIPVFGNGDVFTAGDCLRMLKTTGCAGVAVGRMAAARPWLFAEWTEGFQAREGMHRHCAFRLADLLERHYDARRATGRMKKFLYYFSAGFRFGHQLWSGVQNLPDMGSIRDRMQAFFRDPQETNRRPNLNFFR